MQIQEAILECMVQGCAVYDSNQRLVLYNQQYVDLFSFPAEFLHPGMAFEEITRYRAKRGDYGVGDVEELVKKHVQRRGKIALPESKKRALPDGSIFLRHRQLMPDGSTLVTYTDITEIERTERALRATEERFHGVFENAGVGIVIRSADRKSREHNR
ncbi:MAG: PAS-domain containing protein, partial [Alphaproteobacteria bacterium]